MYPKAILFGAIGTLTETSELQRQAFNAAFAEAGLDWKWEQAEYFEMLRDPGGRKRVAAYADDRGETIDADWIHELKVRHFAALAEQVGLIPRSGVTELVDAAQALGTKLAFVTTTGRDTVDLVLNGMSSFLRPGDFDLITDRAMVETPKPDPEVYHLALRELGLDPQEVVAIEDTPESARAAIRAGIPTFGSPGQAARGRAFPGTVAVVDVLGPDILHTELPVTPAA